jgi:superfamily II DNA or RNA helicase
MFKTNTWSAPDARVMSHRGYAIRKDQLTPAQTKAMREALTMKPTIAPEFAGGVDPFPIYFESPSRWYVPRFWGIENCGEPDGDARKPGLPLRPELLFNKTLRAEQLPIVDAFRDNGWNGLICVPCGYGKTFMGIWLALQMRRRFLIVVHQEFLMEQWRKELESSVPGIRIGILQGSKVQTGYATPTEPTVAELKERLRARGLRVGGTRAELLERLRAVEPAPEPVLYDCCICMIQTVASREWPADTFSGFGFTIFDECHHLGAEHFSKVLMSIQTRNMLGLSATPERLDGLDNVFQWFIGPVRYQIKVRDPDESVEVRVLRFTSADPEYADTPTDVRGEVCRPKLCNQLAGYALRTRAIADELHKALDEGRKLLILSDRREHLAAFEAEFKRRGFSSIGYYVGGMKAAARDLSATKQIVLGTFTLAAEGMNIRDLNTVALVTPKSRIEQAVGRIFRLKKEERTFQPLIFDVIDAPHDVCVRQYRKRRDFYRQCKYRITMIHGDLDVAEGPAAESDSDDDGVVRPAAAGGAGRASRITHVLPAGPLFRS